MIREGFSENIDSLRNAKTDGKKWLAALEEEDRERTGIRNLRIKYNKVFGYYFEVARHLFHNRMPAVLDIYDSLLVQRGAHILVAFRQQPETLYRRDHRSKHGREIHLYAADGPDRADGTMVVGGKKCLGAEDLAVADMFDHRPGDAQPVEGRRS